METEKSGDVRQRKPQDQIGGFLFFLYQKILHAVKLNEKILPNHVQNYLKIVSQKFGGNVAEISLYLLKKQKIFTFTRLFI